MAAAAAIKAERTVDGFLGGRVMLVQPRDGHRAGLDAALLQAIVPAAASGRVVDLGAGVGTVAFSVAARAPNISAIGVERDGGLVACGIEALKRPENAAFADRVSMLVGDATASELQQTVGLGDGSADWVLMNPPFDSAGRGSRSPDTRRRDAHVAEEGLLKAWTKSAAALLRSGGTLGIIHRADALAEVLDALSGRFGDIGVLPVYPTARTAASRILVRARRGRRTPLAIRPGLILHRERGDWTPEADAILRGEAELAF